ncbi:DMT family transporter [Tianweitania populi]|uniref:Peptide ABC transporter ATP-binding protein n=1 Tax=Tianweitania populi TaxID=1607949 RepID=A0A8J3DS03_9HYPH|nr:DMT family transporter [Tianweitania populi]GHD18865.1 peptide ABC transporter ATP-binding protein [Tianweitania populi]
MPASLFRFMPALFVVLWSTGFIGARYAMPYAEPLGFLAIRFGLSFVILLCALLILRKPRLPARIAMHAAIAGALLHGVYLGFVFWVIHEGFPAGLTAAIVSLQPVLVAIFAALILRETVTWRQWMGIALGLVGTVLVLLPKLGFTDPGVTPMTIAGCVLALLGISAGTLWQKRFVGQADLLAGTLWQYLGATVVMLIPAMLLEEGRLTWNPSLVLSLLWLVFGLSLGAIFLLMAMIKNGAVSKVSSLFYLVPSVTALMAFVLFGEQLELVQLAGMVLVGAGVALATRQGSTLRRASR